MYSAMTHVILPGLGSVCPECFSRGHVRSFPVVTPETYAFCLNDADQELEWDVDAARRLLAACPRAPYQLDPVWLLPWLVERSHFTLEHLNHIPSDKLDEPGIVVELSHTSRSG